MFWIQWTEYRFHNITFFVTAKAQSAPEALFFFFPNEKMENSEMCFVTSLIARV